MSFQCFVCKQTFKLKEDDAHHQYYVEQEQKVILQFSEMAHKLPCAAANLSSLHPSVLEVLSVQIQNVDIDDLPSSKDMVIDQEDRSDLDNHVSISSEETEQVEDLEDKENEALLSQSVDASA
ncbi:hypothetical protein GYMLUDRAFT_239426 [Collybiopsis luxurians FD-317 M1]|nr:hypothetical protein GYMLUDRAFT_239426 [Collybiopsis luxurians FD-317 M1]